MVTIPTRLLKGRFTGLMIVLLIVRIDPNSLSVSAARAQAAGWGEPITPLLQYYSFSTLATLGFGDVTPLGRMARALSVAQGVCGQL